MASLTQAEIGTMYRRCNPEEFLYPDDARNVDIEAQWNDVRGEWIEGIYTKIVLGSGDAPSEGAPACVLFTGLPGSGKSTELLRLALRLRDAGFLTVRIDANRFLDLQAPLDFTDLFLVMLHEAEKAVLLEEGLDPNRPGSFTEFERVYRWFKAIDPVLQALPFGVDGRSERENVVGEFRRETPLRKRLRELVAQRSAAFFEETWNAFLALDQRTRAVRLGNDARWRGLTLLVDSLELLRGAGAAYGAVVQSADKVFSSAQLRLPVHAIYTVPPSVLVRLPLQSVHYLPMVKLHARGARAPHEPGYEVMREIVRRRVPDEALAVLLGPAYEARTRIVIEASGGYPRALLKILQELLAAAKPGLLPALDGPRFDHVLRKSAQPLIAAAHSEGPAAMALLRTVATTHELQPSPEQRELVSRLLDLNITLHYQNGDWWYDVHPWVRPALGLGP